MIVAKYDRFRRQVVLVAGAVLLLGGALRTNAALNIVSLSPANGATNVCTDTPLRITFDSAPNYGSVTFANSERITIYAQDGTPVDVIDMSLNVNKTAITPGSTNVQTRFIAATNGSTFSYFTFPIIVSGNTATIFPHNVALTNNQTYYVNITSQLFTNSANGNFAGISDSTTWSFTTKPSKPPTGTNVLNIAADGTGDFCTVQGALDFLPAANSSHVLFNIHKGVYQEIVFDNAKNNITFRGEDRKQTMITYPDNDNLNSGASKRSMFFVSGDDVVIENLTLTNSTPHGGSQSEALRMGGRRFIANNCDLDSYQDTVLVNSSSRYAYFYNCLIQGDVDFIWNDACAVFQSCEIKSLTSGGYNCQMRTPDSSHNGAIFLDCMLTKASGVSSTYLNRIDPNVYPDCMVAYINCRMDTHILSLGWRLDGETAASPTNNLRLWEYQSTNITGTAAINVSGRAGCSRQLTDAEAKALRNLTNVFGVNLQWLPQLAPNIITQPTNQAVAAGSDVTFTAVATGIQTTNPVALGDPTIIVPQSYQWLKNGTNLDGATNASLTLTDVQNPDGGTYSLVVSNLAGVAVSSNVTLTFTGNTAPVFGGASDQTVNVGVNVSVNNTATDSDVPAQTLTYDLLTGPTGSLLDTNTGAFTWRPDVTFSDTTNPVALSVTDDGAPPLSATQSFRVIVNPLTQATIGSVVKSGGQLSFTVSGQTGPDYAILTSTNLTNWSTLFVTNSPTMPFTWRNPNIGTQPVLFYRIKAGPPLP